MKERRIRFGSRAGYEEVVIKYLRARAGGINTDEFQPEKRKIWHQDVSRGKQIHP